MKMFVSNNTPVCIQMKEVNWLQATCYGKIGPLYKYPCFIEQEWLESNSKSQFSEQCMSTTSQLWEFTFIDFYILRDSIYYAS